MTDYPKVTRDASASAFFESARRGQLLLKRSRAGSVLPPHASADPDGASGAPEGIAATGAGTLVSWAVVHQAPHPLLADAVPYASAVVELDEGPWLIVRLVADYQRLRAGIRVRARFEVTGTGDDRGEVVPVFEVG